MSQVTVSPNLFSTIISQVSFVLKGASAFDDAQKRVLKWAFDPAKRTIKGIPREAWLGEAFDIDRPDSERVSAVKLETPKYWAFQLRENFRDPKQRGWVTEVSLGAQDQDVTYFGCRVICVHNGQEPLPRSIPTFVRGIAYKIDSFLDEQKISDSPIKVDMKNVDWLVSFIESKKRKHPIIVFSLPECSHEWTKTAFDPRNFVRRTVGFAHHAIVSSDASFAISDHFGETFSVFNSGVRTYNPYFDIISDSPTDHPVATYAKINSWEEGSGESFVDFLVRQTLHPQKPRELLEKEVPSFQKIKQLHAEHSRKKIQSKPGYDANALLCLADTEINAAKTDADEWKAIAMSYESELQENQIALGRIKAKYNALQHRLDKIMDSAPKTKPNIPTDFENISTWIDDELEGYVEVHPKALKALTSSGFQNTDLVYQSLLLLRDYYVPMKRRGGLPLKNAFDARCSDLGLEVSTCFSDDNKAKAFGDTYFRIYNGKKVLMNFHLKGSSSRDTRLGFRLYYFWDPESEQVVVGHFPTHLDIDAT